MVRSGADADGAPWHSQGCRPGCSATHRGRDAAGARGRFRLEFDELHPAGAADALRARARRAFCAGLRLWDRGDATGARRQLGEARDLSHRAGDDRGEIDAVNEIGSFLIYQSDVPRTYAVLDGALAAA